MVHLSLIGKSFEELMALFFCEVSGDDDFYDVIGLALAEEHGDQLSGMLPYLSPKRQTAAIFGLGALKEEKHIEVIKSYFKHTDPMVAASAIDALRNFEKKDARWVDGSLVHSSPYVRGAALRYLRAVLGDGSLSLLRAALSDPHPIVRENALDEMEGLVRSEDIEWIRPFLNDSANNVVEAARWLIEAIENRISISTPS